MKRLLTGLSSLRLTLGAMLTLFLVILYDLQISELHGGWLAGCFGLLSVNLAAAIIVRPQFRRQPGLLVFHICLMSVAGLAAVQVLTSFEGRIELAENQAFSPAAVEVLEQGPWHLNRLGKIEFVQGPVRVDYRPNLRRGGTRTEIFQAEEGELNTIVFGDTLAFRDQSYRFVTTSNKGFALTLNWRGNDGLFASGNIHMPSFPIQEWKQRKQWTTPAGEAVELELKNPPVSTAMNWTLSSRDFDGRVFLMRQDDTRVELKPGIKVNLNGGELSLDDVVLWIGYRIESNAILPWLFVSATFGVAALGWHFWQNPPAFKAVANNRAKPIVS